jgi:hypothetical protein
MNNSKRVNLYFVYDKLKAVPTTLQFDEQIINFMLKYIFLTKGNEKLSTKNTRVQKGCLLELLLRQLLSINTYVLSTK